MITLPSIEFIGTSRENAEAQSADTSRLINCYRQPTGNPEFPYLIKSTLGQEAFADIDRIYVRALKDVAGFIYAACGGHLFRVGADGIHEDLGAILDGDTTIAGNNGTVTISAGGAYYTYDGAIESPTTGIIENVGSVDYLGQFTVVSELNGRRFAWSGVANPKVFAALDFATKEGRDDNIVQVKAINGRLWLFGEESTEIWYQTGQADSSAFERLVGGVLDVGIRAHGLVTEFPNGAFFIGSDGRARITDGTQSRPVSTPAIDVAIRANKPTRCFYYEDDGQSMCVIGFSDRPAWVYDIATGEWHERARGANFEPWPVVASVQAYGSWFTGYDTGEIRKLSRNNRDISEPLVRRVVSRNFHVRKQRIKSLEIFARMGESALGFNEVLVLGAGGGFALEAADSTALKVGDDDDSPRDAKIALRISEDGGHTWRQYSERSLGGRGDYRQRAVWNSMGQFKWAAVELTISDPGEIPIYSVGAFETS